MKTAIASLLFTISYVSVASAMAPVFISTQEVQKLIESESDNLKILDCTVDDSKDAILGYH